MTLYLAYASNLCPLQMKKRCPSSIFIDTLELSGWELFIMGRGYASIRNAVEKSTLTAIYKLTPECEASLDIQERVSEGYYKKHYININKIDHLIYIAHDTKNGVPYRDYKHRILAGLKYRNAPDHYIAHFEQIKDSGKNSPDKDYSDDGGGFNRETT